MRNSQHIKSTAWAYTTGTIDTYLYCIMQTSDKSSYEILQLAEILYACMAMIVYLHASCYLAGGWISVNLPSFFHH